MRSTLCAPLHWNVLWLITIAACTLCGQPAQSCSLARSTPHPQEWLPDSLEWDWPDNPVEYSERAAAWLAFLHGRRWCSGEAQC